MDTASTTTSTRFRLELVQVKQPCPADWDGMKPVAGESANKARHCSQCDLNVYNLSSMTKTEAEDFLLARSGFGRTCIRFYRREDGTVVSNDCSIIRKALKASAVRARVLAGAALLAISGALAGSLAASARLDASSDPMAGNSEPPMLSRWVRSINDKLATVFDRTGQRVSPPVVQGKFSVMGSPAIEMGDVAWQGEVVMPNINDYVTPATLTAATHAVSRAP